MSAMETTDCSKVSADSRSMFTGRGANLVKRAVLSGIVAKI